MSILSNDDLLATLSSPAAGLGTAISPVGNSSSTASWSQVSLGTSSLAGGGLKLFKVFATDATGCQTLCRHSVGKDAGRVCLAPALPHAETCGTKHQGSFFPLDPLFLYIISQKSPKLTVFEDPKVPCGNLDPTYKTLLMDLSLTLEGWRSLFVLLRSLGDNGGCPAEAQ
jgi:hypothetical protein